MSNLFPLPPRVTIMTRAEVQGANCDLVVAAHLRWLALAGLSAGTIEARRLALARLQTFLQIPLLEASAADLAIWRERLTVAPDTVGDYVSHARQFFAWAVATGLLEQIPTTGLPVPARTRRLPRPIAEQDLLAAVAGAPERIRPWLVLAGWAGLRAKEIALLRRDRVLNTAVPPVLLIAYDATKGRKERVVPLSGFVLAELEPRLPPAGWVFRRVGGRGPNTPARVSQLANRYLHEIGITATLHQLRHRFGTIAYQRSHDLRLVQELMGHARPETTAGYTAYDTSDAAAVVEDLPAPGRLKAISE